MKLLITAMVAMVAVADIAAKDLYWWGDGSDDTWEANGKKTFREDVTSQTAVSFQNGDNATFKTEYMYEKAVKAVIGSTLTVGDLLFDLSRDFTVTNTANRTMTVNSFTKRGTGTLCWKPHQTTMTIADNTINIEGGRLELEPKTQNVCLGTVGDATHDGTTIHVKDGAEFRVRMRNSLSGTAARSEYGVNVNVEEGGTFSIQRGANSSQTQNFVRRLTLAGGTLNLASQGYGTFGLLGIAEKLSVSGKTPYVFAKNGTYADNYMCFGKHEVEVEVADITGDDQADATFAAGYPMIRYADRTGWPDAVPIRKTGSGTLCFKSPVLDAGNYTAVNSAIDGDITIEGGTLSLMTNSCVYGGFDRTITVKDGATLHIGWHNPFHTDVTDGVGGAAGATPAHVVTAIDVKKGGTLLVKRSRSTLEDGSVAFGPLLFEDATFDYSDFYTGGSALGVIQFTDKVWFKQGTTKKVYSLFQTNKAYYASKQITRSCILLNGNPEICVDDITGDDKEDVILAHNLIDTTASPSGFVKTGAGTLRLGGNDANTSGTGNYNKNNGKESSIDGDVTVREGTLQIGPDSGGLNYGGSWLGTMTTNMAHRTITVESGATLYLPNRNIFYSSVAVTNRPYNATVVIKGTYRQNSGQVNILPNLTVDGGTLDLAGQGTGDYGVMMVAGTFKVTGSSPCEILLPSGVESDHYSMFSLNGEPETVFDIEDVTKDSAPDFTITRTFAKCKRIADSKIKVGFTKRGAGTMRVAGSAYMASRDVDGDIKVEAGTLQVDGDNLKSANNILVSSGASIGGAGTVARVTLAEGASFRVQEGNNNPLRITGDLTIAGTPRIDIDGTDITRATVATVGGTMAGSFDNARIYVDGELASGWKVAFADGKLTVKKVRGLICIIQ